MRASPYIGPFEERVRLWETKLNLVQETLDQWLQCQQGWLYLEPIFGSEDIMQQLPNEGRKFKASEGLVVGAAGVWWTCNSPCTHVPNSLTLLSHMQAVDLTWRSTMEKVEKNNE
jgi:hypothetical protein